MTKATRGKLLLLAFNVPTFIYVIVVAVNTDRWWAYAAVAISVVALLGAVAFFFPDHTVLPIAEAATRRRTRREAFRSGRLGWAEVRWLLTRRRNRRYAFVADGVHDLRAERRLTRLVVDRSTEDPRYGHIVPMWMRLGHDRELLTHALAARLDPRVLFRHLDGTAPLDPPTVATMAALVDDQRGDDPAGDAYSEFMVTTRLDGVRLEPSCRCALTH